MDGNPCSIGALSRVFESDRPTSEAAPHPILQVLNVKKLTSAGGPARYRVVFSDTQYFIQSMLSPQINPLVESRDLAKGCFVRLEGYREFNIVNKRLLIALELEVLREYGEQQKIGEPVWLPGPAGVGQQQSPAPAFYGPRPTLAATAKREVAPRSGARTARGAP